MLYVYKSDLNNLKYYPENVILELHKIGKLSDKE